MSRTLIVVPARLSSRRLPRKVLLPIAGKPLLIWSCESAERGRRLLQDSGEAATLLVACADQEIADCAERHGFSAILTDEGLPSGSDRVSQAVDRFDPPGEFEGGGEGEFEIVINCQADLPVVEARVFVDAVAALRGGESGGDGGADIATPIAAIGREQAQRSSVVKAILAGEGQAEERQAEEGKNCSYRVLAFTRACAPWSEETDARYWHHMGLYAYRREALSRFVSLAPSALERREGLEQMRALEAGMKIVAFVCDSVSCEINLEDERAAFEQRVLAAEGG